jgi:hypothetical protein
MSKLRKRAKALNLVSTRTKAKFIGIIEADPSCRIMDEEGEENI